MSIRMKDIAKDLGVSVITISKVLRNHPDVGDETRERVLARVKELDYRPNLAARSLATGRTYLIGLVVPDLLHPFFAEIAKALSEVLRQSGYYLIVSPPTKIRILKNRRSINFWRVGSIHCHRFLPYYGRSVLSHRKTEHAICFSRSRVAWTSGKFRWRGRRRGGDPCYSTSDRNGL